jgi:V8-like Glu-specific endopeptidase
MKTKRLSIFLLLITVNVSAIQIQSTSRNVLYGEDNRQEVFSTANLWQNISESVAVKVSIEHIIQSGNSLALSGAPLSKKVCAYNRFSDQITVPSCSGFLAKPNVLVSAGHCFRSQEDCDKFVWVFAYKLKSSSDKDYTKIDVDQVYSCKRIISRQYADFGAVDYTIIELDRPVKNRQPLKLGFDHPVYPGMKVTSIGHPSGLPLKFADSATIIRISDANRTLDTNLDEFQGNSGSPIFDAETGIVIGIASHGQADHVRDPKTNCKIPRVCIPGDNCYWSSSSRISNLKNEAIFNTY